MGAMKDKAIELHNASTADLWHTVRKGDWYSSTAAADELERRMPGLCFNSPNTIAVDCVNAAARLDQFHYGGTINTLRRAADEIARLEKRIEDKRLLDELKKLAPTPTETRLRNEATDLLKRIDGLNAANREAAAKISELQDEINRIKSAQSSLDEITRICRTRWDNERREDLA